MTYTVVVSNAGPQAANATTITDAVPETLSEVTITCVAAGGAVCPATTGLTTLNAVVIPTLPSGGSVTFTISGTAPTSGSLSNSASVTPPPGVTDPDPGNNVGGPVVTEITPVPEEADVSVTKVGRRRGAWWNGDVHGGGEQHGPAGGQRDNDYRCGAADAERGDDHVRGGGGEAARPPRA